MATAKIRWNISCWLPIFLVKILLAYINHGHDGDGFIVDDKGVPILFKAPECAIIFEKSYE